MFQTQIKLVRKYLEARANAIRRWVQGLARVTDAPRYALEFSDSTDDQTLLNMVLDAESAYFHYTTAQVPVCYGKRWSAVEAETCQRCRVQTLCLHRFAFKTLPEVRAKLPDGSDTQIAQQLDTELSALPVAAAFSIYVHEGSSPACPPIPNPLQKPVVGQQLHSVLTAEPTALTPTPRDVLAGRLAAQSVLVPDAVSLPPGKQGRKRTRQPVKKPPGRLCKNGSKVYGEHTFAARFQRERKRNPNLNLLPVGAKMIRPWRSPSGRIRTVKVTILEDGYLYNNQKFPTLYDVAKAATGAVAYKHPKGTSLRYMSNWSGSRFFRDPLKQLLGSQQI